jgi:phospholipid/cholesterol/gamma-HCH transport system substrate-binding protein
MCESDENYVPLNDGFNWKGDPNATLSGQGITQLPTDSAAQSASGPPAAPPPLAVAEYDPATGSYIGPDGHSYVQSNLNQSVHDGQTWQSMLVPPAKP